MKFNIEQPKESRETKIPHTEEALEIERTNIVEALKNGDNKPYEEYIEKLRVSIDTITNTDERARAQIELIITQAGFYKDAEDMAAYTEALDDALDYAEGMQMFDLCDKIEKLKK